jgi:glycosyltransferase involved in cell wall biosynthesis
MAGPGVTFLGWRPDAEVAELYARCRAVLFPSVEDFGIVPLEAAAAGRPTVALARGGALETMVGLDDDAGPPTAVFFGEQTVESLAGAMRALEAAAGRFEPRALRARAALFDRPLFVRRVRDWIDARWGETQARRAC